MQKAKQKDEWPMKCKKAFIGTTNLFLNQYQKQIVN
jgi:hypothetical protein